MRKRLLVLLLAGGATAVALMSPAVGQEPPPAVGPDQPASAAAEATPETMGYEDDDFARMTVPVSIGESGPYRFVVDTGAERTVISRELANNLGLQDGRRARMHSLTEVSNITTVIIPEIMLGTKRVSDIHAPALGRRNMGADGMLGVDSLQSQRVLFDFVNQEMTMTPSRRAERRWPSDTIVVTARNRFGHLVLLDASLDGQKVYAIIDTGSQVTIGNMALRRKLEGKRQLRQHAPLRITSVTGGSIMAEQAISRSMTIGGAEIRDMVVAFADIHPFRKLELMDRPALLIGMDTLRLFDRVSVDFANRRVRLLMPGQSRLGDDTQMAREQPERSSVVG